MVDSNPRESKQAGFDKPLQAAQIVVA